MACTTTVVIWLIVCNESQLVEPRNMSAKPPSILIKKLASMWDKAYISLLVLRSYSQTYFARKVSKVMDDYWYIDKERKISVKEE